jgi:hypothetical protein
MQLKREKNNNSRMTKRKFISFSRLNGNRLDYKFAGMRRKTGKWKLVVTVGEIIRKMINDLINIVWSKSFFFHSSLYPMYLWQTSITLFIDRVHCNN